MNPVLRKAIIVSCVGHFAFIGAFSLSFGPRMRPYASAVNFWGEMSGSIGLSSASRVMTIAPISLHKVSLAEMFHKPQQSDASSGISAYVKPTVTTVEYSGKESVVFPVAPVNFQRSQKETAIFFHPLLPSSFSLYFRDRPSAHVELMLQVSAGGMNDAITVKRKISSGNLEVDLLSARYLSHYLFFQQQSFTPGQWHTLRIDLSARND